MKLWKWSVGMFFLLVIVDGALRKWVLPGQSQLLFVLKDAVLWGGFLAYASWRSPTQLPRPVRRTWVPVLLGAYIFFVAGQAFNPRIPALTVSGLGLKAHLAFVPLIVMVPAIFADLTERKVMRGLWSYAVLVVFPLAALSIYQFYQPPSAWVNQYVRDMGATAAVEGHVRVISTFSYIGSHTSYLTFNAFLSIGVLLAGIRTQRGDLLCLGGLLFGATAVVLPMAGSRGPIVIVAVALAALLLLVESRHSGALRVTVVLLLTGVVVVQGTGLTEGWEVLAERAVEAGDTENRIESILMSPVEGLERGGLLGYGAGSAHQAAPRFVAGAFTHDWLPESFIESSIAREMIELGALGWLVLITLKGTLLYLAYQTVQRSRRPLGVIVGVTAFCMLLAQFLFPVTYNVVANAFYWGTAGAMLGVWSLQEVRLRGTRPHSGTKRKVPS